LLHNILYGVVILMKCSLCDREAFTYIPYARLRLCREHFGEFIRSKVVRARKGWQSF